MVFGRGQDLTAGYIQLVFNAAERGGVFEMSKTPQKLLSPVHSF
jgi:hypothetical protein